MPSKRKPKLIPLKELRALCKEAGVSVREPSNGYWDWYLELDGKYLFGIDKDDKFGRLKLKATCLGLIAMGKRSEL